MMGNKPLTAIVTGLLVLGSCSLEAASYRRRGYGRGGTVANSTANGMAAVIRAEGAAAKDLSQARINDQQARSKYIDNKKKWAEVYISRHKAWELVEHEKHSKESHDRDNYLARHESHTAPRLTSAQLDPTTGAIHWPLALTADAYAPQRKKAEELLTIRKYTGPSDGLVQDVNEVAASFSAELRTRIDKTNPNDYIAARKFLDSLQEEIHHPAN